MTLIFALLLLAADPAPAAPAGPVGPPPNAVPAGSVAPSAGADHTQTTAEWTAWCQAQASECQANLSKLVLNRARMAGAYGCAEETDDKIRNSVLKWMSRHPKVADQPVKEGLTTAIEDIWICLKPKFQGRIP